MGIGYGPILINEVSIAPLEPPIQSGELFALDLCGRIRRARDSDAVVYVVPNTAKIEGQYMTWPEGHNPVAFYRKPKQS